MTIDETAAVAWLAVGINALNRVAVTGRYLASPETPSVTRRRLMTARQRTRTRGSRGER